MSRAPRSAQARHSWGDDDSATPILHVDMDAFFVSVELLYHPELRGKPVAVGGVERGVVAAASYEARAFGVNSAMPVSQAYRKCPNLIMLPVRGSLYGEYSDRIMKILHDITPRVEKISVDEAFLDVSGARRLFGSPVEVGALIRRRIRQEIRVPASVGIAATKHVAKIASVHAKPDGLLLIPADKTQDFLVGLPVGALWGVGPQAQARLKSSGITTVGDVVATGQKYMERLLGKAVGAHVYALACGHDERGIEIRREEKSVGREETFFDPLTSRSRLDSVLLAQADDVAARLRGRKLRGRTVAIKVRFTDFTTITRSSTPGTSMNNAIDIYRVARHLLDGVDIPEGGVRLLGVRVEGLEDAKVDRQLALDENLRRADVDGVIDEVRERFGFDSLGMASVLKGKKREKNAQ